MLLFCDFTSISRYFVPPIVFDHHSMAEEKGGKRIGTHSGGFHCDEALACFMLKQLPDYKDAEIIRYSIIPIFGTI